jgi:acetyl esterase/lipase
MPAEEPTSNVKPHHVPYGPEYVQFGELYLPASAGGSSTALPVVVLIHGGYWRARYDLTLMDGLAQDLAMRGYAAWNIEYRRVGDPGGGWPGTFLDVARAADHVQVMAASYGLDSGRVVAIGHSAGGHLAFWLAARASPRIPAGSPLAALPVAQDARHSVVSPLRLAGVISLAGVLDLEAAWKLHLSNDAVVELLGEAWPDAPDRYNAASPAALLPLGVPQVLLHGTRDVNVPIEISRDYAAKARAMHDPVEYIELEGVDHFDLIDPRSYAWSVTIGALERLLEGQARSL